MWEKDYKMRKLSFIFFLGIISFFTIFGNVYLYSEPYEILEKKRLLIQKRKEILKLTKQERRTFKNLARLEKKIVQLEEKISMLEGSLRRLKIEKKLVYHKLEKLKKEIKVRKDTLKKLLNFYWFVYLKRAQMDLDRFLESWSLYQHWVVILNVKLVDDISVLAKFIKELNKTLKRKQLIERDIKAKTKALIKERESVLDKKLFLLQEIRRIRALKIQKEAQLKQIRETIKRLKLASLSFFKTSFVRLKGRLPWPVKGRVVYRFNMRHRPPREGIGIRVSSNTQVKVISWGKVVFSDKLRGFGNVIIVFHGNDFYSLYAYLKRVYVFVGQRVERSEIIGVAGFCPKCRGYGVYFELRKGKRPVNPLKWLKKS